MKVYISNYRNHWISPYTILEKIFFWREIEYDEPIIEKWSDRILPFCQAWQKFLDYVHPQINYVSIDRWDTWSMDNTLAHIVLPMLKQLKETKHGSGLIDMEDVPESMRMTSHEEWDSQKTFDFYNEPDLQKVQCDIHNRYEWVLDEMIFAFEHKLDDSWEDAFRSGKHDITWIPVDAKGNEVPKGEHKYYQMGKGPNDTYECDYEGMKVVQDRINNGFRLFGKYYQSLWD
jgi:hypothetical protein